MGKSKKGKPSAKDDDMDSDIDVEELSVPEPVKKSKTKEKKKNKKQDDFDDLADDFEELKVEKPKGKKGKKSNSDDEVIVPSQSIKSKPSAAKGGFALLAIEGSDNDDNDDDDEDKEPPQSEDESEKTQSIERSKRKPKQSQENQETQDQKGKKGKKKQDSESVPEMDNDGEIGGTVKTAAQKKKEKKEREKLKKMAQKKAELSKKPESESTQKESTPEASEKTSEKPDENKPEDNEEETEGKKKKKKGAKEEVKKDKTKGPGNKVIAAMQEALRLAKEEEERRKREEEELIRQEELREKARLEQLQLEQERKEKKKLKEKQRKERLKAEGKLLTTKQKQDRARAQAMLEALKAQGMEIPDATEKKTRTRPSLGTRLRPSKLKQQTSQEEEDRSKNQVQLEIVDQKTEQSPELSDTKVDDKTEEDAVKDSWDVDSTEDELEEDKSEDISQSQPQKSATDVKAPRSETKKSTKKDESSESESESGSESEEDSEDDSEVETVDERLTDAEKKREKVRLRIENRRIEAEKKKSLDVLRAAVVCVLGHVDTGKTKILDKLRRTNVQDSEAGGITQQIGATNVPISAIHESTRHVKGFTEKTLKIPGLLIIDTPGHESFSNLRNRGSSLCDIAVLVVDIMHGLEPQTLESIDLLKSKKCPFVVALNKIDRLYDWQTMNRKDVHDIIKSQSVNTQREFESRAREVINQLAEKKALNAALYYENPDPKHYVSLVPTSAITGEGMGNLLALIVDACQERLAKRLMYSEELQATVLEVKVLPGLGTTIDCILVNGTLREGDTMVVAGTDGPIVTQIRSLLMPQPLKELRVKNAYIEHREVQAAQGVKIAAKDLEKAIAGLNLLVAQKPDEVDFLKAEISKDLSKALAKIKLDERGVYVQASTLGALEALLEFLKTSEIPYAGIRIGPVVKRDVMKASIMLEHDSQYATILAFDVKIERDAQELADSVGVKIFQADIIYHLFDKFIAYRDELKQRKRDEFKNIAVFPCKLKILPQYIFNSRDPIVMGVMVEAGIVKEGTPVCVPSKDFVDLGVVTSIEYNHKAVESARKGQEVCVKIEPVPGEAPKMFGRHFDDKDFIVSKISRQSIDACKNYFRDDLLITDWKLMKELKTLFQIM